MKGRLSTRELVWAALFSALIAVGAFIKIPLGVVPLTLQLFFVILAGLLLGARLGFIAVFTYVAIGLLGIPVFTRGGGIGYVLQPTFGYILGFCFAAFVAGLIVEKSAKKTLFTYLTGGNGRRPGHLSHWGALFLCIDQFLFGRAYRRNKNACLLLADICAQRSL